MNKIRLTEKQISMVQKRDKDLSSKKVLMVSEGQYNRLFKSGSSNVKKNVIKESDEKSELNPSEFAQELIVFIKDVIANPKKVPFSKYWTNLNISRAELFSMIKKEGLLTMMVGESDVKSYKAKKHGFRKGIKELCNKIMENQLNEDGDYPAGAEFDSRAPYNDNTSSFNGSDSNRSQGERSMNPIFDAVHFNANSDDLMILKNKDNLYAFMGTSVPEESYKDFIDMEGIVDYDAIFNYVNVSYKEKTIRVVNDNADNLDDGQIVKIGPNVKQQLIDWYGGDDEMISILNQLPETTGAASSGSFVGGMSNGPIQKKVGISPEDAMKDLNEDMAVNKFLVTYNLDDNGGDTSPFLPVFHEVQIFMSELVGMGITSGVKVGKTDNSGKVVKEFTYDFDGEEWQNRDNVNETTTTVGVGGDSGTFAYDAPAGDGSKFWNAGNKQNKKMPMVKKQLGESTEPNTLATHISDAIAKVDDSLSYKDFGIAVAKVIKDSYGQHLIKPFLKVLTKELGQPDGHLSVNEGIKVGQVYMNGSGRARIDAIIDDNSMTVTRWGDMERKNMNLGINQLGGWTLLEGKKILKVTESQLKSVIESDNQTKTAFPNGKMVDFDDCTKLNNNKVAQNGGCSQGDDGVVKLTNTEGY